MFKNNIYYGFERTIRIVYVKINRSCDFYKVYYYLTLVYNNYNNIIEYIKLCIIIMF